MHAAADRPEFAPPPQPGMLRGFALAVLAHLLLIAALTHGLRWQREVQDAAVEAELWSALPQEAAPKAEPVQPAPPPPPPVVKAPPQPEPPAKSEADIALEREKQKRVAEQRRQAELEKQRAERAKAEAARRKHDEELARRKLEQQKLLAEAKKKEEEKKRKLQEQQEARLAKQREQLREETLKRMQGLAGGTGSKDSQGTAARASGPSASWAGRVQARVRPNIVYPDHIAGNPQAIVEVRLGPGGMILGKPRLVKPSGVPSWDEAVIRALEKTETLPADTDGRYPSPVEISFRPKA